MVFKNFNNNLDGNLIDTATPDQSEPGSNVNEDIPYTLKISRTVASPSDVILYRGPGIPLLEGLISLQGITVSVDRVSNGAEVEEN